MCPAWRDDFAAFFAHIGPRPSHSHSIDRIDNDGNYEPGNVRWATGHEQAGNTSRSRHITHAGTTRPIAEWARVIGISEATLRERLARGWPVDRALGPKTQAWVRHNVGIPVTIGGVTRTMTEWAHHAGLNHSSLYDRLGRGWSLEKSLTTPKLR